MELPCLLFVPEWQNSCYSELDLTNNLGSNKAMKTFRYRRQLLGNQLTVDVLVDYGLFGLVESIYVSSL